MRAEQLAFALFGYAMIGFVVSAMSFLWTENKPIGPPGSEPAIAFLIGALWPLSVVFGVAWGAWLLVVQVAGGFAVLWRHWRPAKPPRATATLRSRQ